MKVVPYQEILEKKFKRQRELIAMGAELHANGHCFRLDAGTVTPGSSRLICFRERSACASARIAITILRRRKSF